MYMCDRTLLGMDNVKYCTYIYKTTSSQYNLTLAMPFRTHNDTYFLKQPEIETCVKIRFHKIRIFMALAMSTIEQMSDHKSQGSTGTLYNSASLIASSSSQWEILNVKSVYTDKLDIIR